MLLEETSSESFNLLWGISQDIDTDTILEAMLDLWVSHFVKMYALTHGGHLF